MLGVMLSPFLSTPTSNPSAAPVGSTFNHIQSLTSSRHLHLGGPAPTCWTTAVTFLHPSPPPHCLLPAAARARPLPGALAHPTHGLHLGLLCPEPGSPDSHGCLVSGHRLAAQRAPLTTGSTSTPCPQDLLSPHPALSSFNLNFRDFHDSTLPMQGTWVQSLVRELDPTTCRN